MMATVPHVTSGSGLRKFQTYGFLWDRVYKFFHNILLSRLTPYAEEIIEYHQCGFRSNRSTTDHIFCIRQILKKMGMQ